MKSILLWLLMLAGFSGYAQQTVFIKIKNEKGQAIGASLYLKGSSVIQIADSTGLPFILPASGNYFLIANSEGYRDKILPIATPFPGDSLVIVMEALEEVEMEEVIIHSTRTSRNIANVPTRVEAISFEEIDEKNNMRPSNVAMLLHESTGIQVQQTSATSGNAGIRIQGLDGRYTQLLKDGFPNFGNFSSGLSVLEIPPLDLRQVEIIKGPASPLYGGGAIAGVVNFISKTPGSKPEYNLLLNQSTIGQSNIGGFASGRGKKAGYTLLALYNRSRAYDVDKDDFSEVPESDELNLHPKLFLYPNEKTTISLGNSITLGKRTGGDMLVIKGKADASHQYFEKNETVRNVSTLSIDKEIAEGRRIQLREGFSIFDRTIRVPSYRFSGIEYNNYTDLSYLSNNERQFWVAGANFIYNRFDEKNGGAERDNRQSTFGLYGQYTWDASEKIKLESGLRLDGLSYRNALYKKMEWFLLPRVSLLVNYNSNWSSRIGGGMGYKAPSLFTEETETIQYRGVSQLNGVRSEKSYGSTADVNFRSRIGEDFSFSFNQMFFYTVIHRPLVLENDAPGSFHFTNAEKPVHSAGFETNARLVYRDHFKVFLGYTFTRTRAEYRITNRFLPLVPRGKLNSALIYEKEGVIKLGLEGYFTGRQYLASGNATPAFSEFGFMAEKIFRRFSLFINLENFTDTRQSRYKPVVNGSHLDPVFDEIWTHTEGFVCNGGVKLRFNR